MKSDLETLSDTRVKLTVDLPFEDLTDELDAAYKRIANQVQIPGFRKGRVPRQIIDQRFGRGAVLEEVVNAAVPPAYDSAIKEAGVKPLGQPNVEITDIVDGERISFVAEVDVRPEFALPQYKGLEIEVDPLTVTDEDVDREVESLAARFGSYEEVDRPAADDDVLLIDMAAHSGGTRIDELSVTAFSYEVGDDGLVPGIDEAVLGKTAGDTAEFSFTPEFGDFAGKPVDVTVTIKAVRVRVLPAIDDELAMLASEFDTLTELRADLRTRLQRAGVLEQGREARALVHDKLLDSVDFPLPEGVIAAEVAAHFENHGDTDDDHRHEVEADARKGLKSQLIMDRIADAEDLSVAEAELSQWLMSQAPQYGMSPDAFAQALVEAGQVPMAVAEVRRNKALALVLENAQVTDTDGNPVDLSQVSQAVQDVLSEIASERESLDDALEDESAHDLDDEDSDEESHEPLQADVEAERDPQGLGSRPAAGAGPAADK